MRVLILTAMFPPSRTGTSFYSKNIANALYDGGIEIRLVTTTNNEQSYKDDFSFPVNRIPAWHIPLKNVFKHLRFCGLIFGNYSRLKKIVEEFRPDAVLLINHYLDIAFLAKYVSRISNVPLYISIGTQLQSLSKFRNSILRILDRLIVGNLVLPKARRIICWDKEIVRYINETHNKKFINKLVIIPFGVNGDIRHYNDFENNYDGKVQILGVGAVISHRDYMYQIKVFSELLKVFPQLSLKIIGNQYIEKPTKYAQQLGISDKVIFTGELPHDDVLIEYQNSIFHWMMLVGNYVGLGTSTMEAMLMGIPVVSNVPENLFGTGELRDMHNYIYTDAKSVDTDVKKLSRIIIEKDLRKRIALNGKEFVLKNLNWENVADQIVLMIRDDINQQA